MKKVPIQQVSRTETIPSPTGGLNTRSPISNMPIDCALQLTNGTATPLGVAARKGYKSFKTGYTNLKSIFSYNGVGILPDRMFVVDNNVIKDTSTVSPIADKSGFTSSIFKTTQMATQGGQFLIAANGFEAPVLFNGYSWVNFTVSATPSAVGQFSITGSFTLNQLTNPIVHQKRLWFVIKNSTRIAYGDINSLGGTLTSFDISGLLPRGGYIHEIISWTGANGAASLQNRLVIVSSEGDVVIFDGADPSVSGSFVNSGVWQLAKPAPKCFINFDSEVLYVSSRGVFPLSNYLQSSLTTQPISLNVSNVLGEMIESNKNNHGFDSIIVDKEHILILNIPQTSIDGNVQFVLNTETQGWSIFVGIPAIAWCNFGGETYFISQTKIFKAFDGYLDDTKSYTVVAQQAYTNLGSSSIRKHVTLCRVNLISATSKGNFQMTVKADFDTSSPNNISSISMSEASLWDSSRFDHSVWGSENLPIAKWSGANTIGSFISVVLVLQVVNEVLWVSSDLVYQAGNIL